MGAQRAPLFRGASFMSIAAMGGDFGFSFSHTGTGAGISRHSLSRWPRHGIAGALARVELPDRLGAASKIQPISAHTTPARERAAATMRDELRARRHARRH